MHMFSSQILDVFDLGGVAYRLVAGCDGFRPTKFQCHISKMPLHTPSGTQLQPPSGTVLKPGKVRTCFLLLFANLVQEEGEEDRIK